MKGVTWDPVGKYLASQVRILYILSDQHALFSQTFTSISVCTVTCAQTYIYIHLIVYAYIDHTEFVTIDVFMARIPTVANHYMMSRQMVHTNLCIHI